MSSHHKSKHPIIWWVWGFVIPQGPYSIIERRSSSRIGIPLLQIWKRGDARHYLSPFPPCGIATDDQDQLIEGLGGLHSGLIAQIICRLDSFMDILCICSSVVPANAIIAKLDVKPDHTEPSLLCLCDSLKTISFTINIITLLKWPTWTTGSEALSLLQPFGHWKMYISIRSMPALRASVIHLAKSKT